MKNENWMFSFTIPVAEGEKQVAEILVYGVCLPTLSMQFGENEGCVRQRGEKDVGRIESLNALAMDRE